MSNSSGNAHNSLSKKLKQRINSEWWLLTTVLCGVTLILSLYPNIFGIKKLENNLYDFYNNQSAHKSPHKDIVIIAIDDNSIDEFGIWPWRRSVHARLLKKLTQANAVVLDFIFTESSPFGKSDDLILANAMAIHGKVFLPLVYSRNYGEITPINILNNNAKNTGYINIALDDDGVVRSFYPFILTNKSNPISHISISALELENKIAINTDKRFIHWVGAPATYEMLPYHSVLGPQFDASYFKGKYVFVGAWSSGMGDTFQTPTSTNGVPMAGVEILANIADNIITDKQIYKSNIYSLLIVNLFFIILACLAVRFFSPQRAFVFIILNLIAVFITTAALFYFFSYWLTPIPSAISIVLTYPIWSWRIQYAALQHIESELSYFINESNNLNPALLSKTKSSNLIHQILGPRTLTELLQDLHTTLENSRIIRLQRIQALSFLSHDMRSPLNAILALCDLYNNQNNRSELIENTKLNKLESRDIESFKYYAQRTLTLVDGFVDLSRAQVSKLQFRDFDLGELIINCCEESWVRAQQKNININYDNVDYGYYLNGDQALMQRVFINLINNAIQYSFANTQIHVSLAHQNINYIVTIQDQGCGISPNHIDAIFSPYSRINASSDMHKPGVGLGLAFVQTVIKRHYGSVNVKSELDKGSTFIIKLPAI